VFAVVGVPLNTPAELSVKPGTLPLVIDQVYGVTPPVAANVVLYAVPTVPLGNGDIVVIDNAGVAAIVNVKLLLAVWWVGLVESVTWNVGEKLPDAVGVPLNAPVDAFNVTPAGKLPLVIDHVYGVVPPVAASVAL
jgi:hypothetical protein